MSHVPNPSTAPPHLISYGARFQTSWPQSATAVVAATGELDAANGAEFVDYALSQPDTTERLILDFSGLTFFATAAFSALHTLNVRCVRAQIRWAMVSSPAVDRLLRICDPDAALRIASDLDAALVAVHDEPPRLLQLVPEPR